MTCLNRLVEKLPYFNKKKNPKKILLVRNDAHVLLQVRVLLIELEEARGNHVIRDEEEVSSADITSTSEVISHRLVTFRSVEELQQQNQRLLVALRELGEAQEKEEMEATSSRYQTIWIWTSVVK